MRILIIANARFKGGISGGDAIYENFKKHWPNCSITVWDMQDIDYKPFVLCYIHRIFISIVMSIFEPRRYEIVYSASDFLPDSISGFIFKIKGSKWVAGFFLKAFRSNPIHYYSQKMVRKLIDWFADMVIVTNPTMYEIFPSKRKTWINGGIDLSLAGLSDQPKIYDAVFCGRIHPSKGIDELIEIWKLFRQKKKDATLAIIGDGDLGVDYIKERMGDNMGVTYFGYMGEERFKVYKQSKVVLYPTPLKYDHFSMAPVEAMACGCPIVHFDTPVMRGIEHPGIYVQTIEKFSQGILFMIDESIDVQSKLIGEYSIFDYKRMSKDAVEWSQKYHYKTQALRVYNDIKKELCL